mmetsp:Transcript_7314/g.21614  ORF Transcript_7314/g.21614 Transcript_7314/m.21614 type:complete len:304 (+) Transcript_7314:253-1164(+)
MGTRPPVRRYMSATSSRAFARRGGPERPPRSGTSGDASSRAKSRGGASASRASASRQGRRAVVLATTRPSRRASRATLAKAARCFAPRSGEILSSRGVAGPRAARVAARMAGSSPTLTTPPLTLGQLALTTTKSTQPRSARATAAWSAAAAGPAGVDAFFVTLAPILALGFSSRAASKRAATASQPSEGRPTKLTTLSSSRSRKTRGRGLPGCGWGVTPPTSTKPKPRSPRPPTARPRLSKPAATPTGLAKVRPSTLVSAAAGGAGATGPRPWCSPATAMECAVSASATQSRNKAAPASAAAQ